MLGNFFRRLVGEKLVSKVEDKAPISENSGDSGIEEGFEHVLPFTEVTDIINKAIKDGDLGNIQDYEDAFVTDLSDENFKNFCIDQLNLKLEDQRIDVKERESKIRSDHQHIYSNILSKYKLDQELKCDYSVKELLLLAIAANDKLVEEYKDVLFDGKILNLLHLLVGGQRYIKVFIGKFPDIYQSLKDQAIQLESGQIGFFSIIALRQEQELLNTVLVEYVLKDLEKVLETSNSHLLYGVLEMVSLAKNEGFIERELDSIERYISDPAKANLLKERVITILDTVISQEHVLIVQAFVKALSKRCTKSNDPVMQRIYEEAFADDRVVKQFNKQVVSKIKNGGNNGARKGKKEVYDMVLETASCVGNIEFIKKVLDLINDDPQLSSDKDKQAFLQNSLITILKSAVGAKSVPVIEHLCTNYNDSIITIPTDKETEGVKKQAAKNILNNVEELVQNALAAKDVNSLRFYVNHVKANVASVKPEVVGKLIEILNQFPQQENAGRGEPYPTLFDKENKTEVAAKKEGEMNEDRKSVKDEISASDTYSEGGDTQSSLSANGSVFPAVNEDSSLARGADGSGVPEILTDVYDTGQDDDQTPVSEQANTIRDNAPPQNTQKSKLPTIAIVTLTAIALGMETAALGMYFALHTSFLAVWIVAAIGACCLVAAAILYCCKPAGLLEDINAKTPALAHTV